ncbi:DNA end protector protein [Paraglaciecola Antarctic GD virus 1]|nr:DNA end protector protein [Paraglaciecola Antarctic GD virus 1]
MAIKRTAEEEDSLVGQFRAAKRKAKYDSQADKNNKSQKWFVAKLKDLKYKTKTRPVTGSMITYVYDAKYKATLPYFDKFPLIILLDSFTKGTWLGLNLHYIPPKQREQFLEQILTYTSSKKIGSNTTFKIDWSKVKNLKYSEYMIKRYLMTQVRSNVSAIPPNEWINAVNLPTQSFHQNKKRFSSRKVWKDSRG